MENQQIRPKSNPKSDFWAWRTQTLKMRILGNVLDTTNHSLNRFEGHPFSLVKGTSPT